MDDILSQNYEALPFSNAVYWQSQSHRAHPISIGNSSHRGFFLKFLLLLQLPVG